MWRRRALASSLDHICVASSALVGLSVAFVAGSSSEGEQHAREDPSHPCASPARPGAKEGPPHDNWQLFPVSRRCQCEGPPPPLTAPVVNEFFFELSRHGTIRKMESNRATNSLHDSYDIDLDAPLGEGTFGSVYLATHRETGEKFALKKISTAATDDAAFRREIEALLHLRGAGGHPNVCGLREHFEGVGPAGDYCLVLDLVSGGEMFDHLIGSGPYSEADAARLMREVASALSFLHGIGVWHNDLKPENLMLSARGRNSAIKIVDFGCADVVRGDDVRADDGRSVGTLGYSPPEALDPHNPHRDHRDQTTDMWAVGIILYIMLVGAHPHDLKGRADDTTIARRIVSKKYKLKLRHDRLTAHLSPSAVHCIERLLDRDPKTRMTAKEMLEDSWIRGETASQQKIADSDTRLSSFRAFRSDLEAKVFSDMVSWSNDDGLIDEGNFSSLIERSFQSFDSENQGFITTNNVAKQLATIPNPDATAAGNEAISLSEFDQFLSTNMKSRYFEKNHVLYDEGDIGECMYFINSGTVEVSTKNGFTKRLGRGDFFGEGALLDPDRVRSAAVRCETPVHAIEIGEDSFRKYLMTSDPTGLVLNMRERDSTRKKNMARETVHLQTKDVLSRRIPEGEALYESGDESRSVYLLEDGRVDVRDGDSVVYSIAPGNMCGVAALLADRRRNSSAVCVSAGGCGVRELLAPQFFALVESSPVLGRAFRKIAGRRRFRRAIVNKTKTSFSTSEDMRRMFDACDADGSGTIDVGEIRNVLLSIDPDTTDAEIEDIITSLDLTESSEINFDVFRKIFGNEDHQ